ncbi:MAG TPA: serine protease [Polyangiaceae bacterium]|jgi:hypothetical protein|nr:serine protease [Polyangiaceae bacterium]
MPISRWAWIVIPLSMACSNSPDTNVPAATAEPEAPPPKEGPVKEIHRVQLDAVLLQGPHPVLQSVDYEEVLEGGKFVGWRIRELPYEWRGVELQSGDIVTAINTIPLEKPEEMWAAWTTLSVASELKVSYLRDGEPRELRLPIIGSPNPELAKKLKEKSKPPQGARQPPPRKKTITIRDDDRPISDTVVDW